MPAARRALLAAPALLAPWAPGGSNDIVARLVVPEFEARAGQAFVIENRPGGGGSIGMGIAMRARPDGHMLLVSSASNHLFHALVSGEPGSA